MIQRIPNTKLQIGPLVLTNKAIEAEAMKLHVGVVREEGYVAPRVKDSAIRKALDLVLSDRVRRRKLGKLDPFAEENAIGRLLFYHHKDPAKRFDEAKHFVMGALLGSLILESGLRKKHAKEIHAGPGTDAWKNRVIGNLLYGHQKTWTPRERVVAAAKWRAAEDVEARMSAEGGRH